MDETGRRRRGLDHDLAHRFGAAAIALVFALMAASACRNENHGEPEPSQPQLITEPPPAGLQLDGKPFLKPLGEVKPDPEGSRRAIDELERRCLGGSRGSDCFIAGSTFETGNEAISKDPARALACYSAGCRNFANGSLHGTPWWCAAAARLADGGTGAAKERGLRGVRHPSTPLR